MRKSNAKKALAVVMLAVFTAPSAAENAVILKQSAPLAIAGYSASFISGYRTSDSIRHHVRVSNTSGKEVVAYQIGLASFDAFNGFMGKFSGWSIEPIAIGADATGTWEQKPYAAFSFEKFGTGVAYVNAIRFSDGTIWRADIGPVLVELQKFEKDLKRDDLKDKQ